MFYAQRAREENGMGIEKSGKKVKKFARNKSKGKKKSALPTVFFLSVVFPPGLRAKAKAET